MGIFIYLDVSKTVTQEEWERAYEETLLLVEKLPLAERRKVPLIYYDSGDTVQPELLENLKMNFAFYDGITQEKEYAELMKEKPHRRCEFLVEENRYILIRDMDWEKIFSDIESNEDSFRRYYPMVRVDVAGFGMADLIKAIVLNDDIYELCQNLIRA